MHQRIAVPGTAVCAPTVRHVRIMSRSASAADDLGDAGERDLLRVGQHRPARDRWDASDQAHEAEPGATAQKSAQGLPEAQAQEDASGVRKKRQEEVRAKEGGQGLEEVQQALREAGQVMSHRLCPVPRALLLALAVSGALLAALAGATPALAEITGTPWWRVTSTVAPTNLPPGGEGQILLTAIDVGDGEVNATASKVTVTDNLPPGLEATPSGARGSAGSLLEGASTDFEPGLVTCETHPVSVTCTFAGPKPLIPFVPLEVAINVKVAKEPAVSKPEGEVTVAGGGAPTASIRQPVTVSSAETPFGVQSYELAAENEGGSLDTQASSHPFQLTTTLALNQKFVPDAYGFLREKFPMVPLSVAQTKDLVVRLPPGLVGNVTSFPQCSEADFSRGVGFKNACPADTAVGVASATLFEPEVSEFVPFGGVATATVPVFNLVPAPGEPARFGFDAFTNFVTLDTSVATGEDYAVVTSVGNITEIASLLSSQVTLWGVPADARHDRSRGWGCLAGELNPSPPCASLGQSDPAPFLTLPGSCTQPLRSAVLADSFREPGARLADGRIDASDPRWKEARSESPALGGCNQVPFTPSISLEPETQAGSTPTGLKVDVHVPQQPSSTANGLAEADVKATTVTLPRGVLLNPAAAHGLAACSEAEIGFNKALPGSVNGFEEFEKGTPTAVFTPTLPEPFCSESSKVGTVRIRTPLLAHELEGAVYLAQQYANPFPTPEHPGGSLIALYIVAQDPVSGVLVKLAGKITLDENTGQVVSTFQNTPQTPFEDLKLQFFSGPTASLTTPPYCGTYTTTASFTPWSGTKAVPGAVSASSSFPITSACTPEGNAQPFAPSFQAGSTNNQAGGFTPFTLTIGNPDGDQALQGLTMKLPDGMAAVLASVTPCPEPQAAKNECGSESLIGHSTANSGLGADPYALPGRVYLTGPYKGAPFGISVVTPAVAGPFNLGNVTVRSTINVDPSTAAVTITSDPFPTFVQGIPTQLKQINVTVDRPGFQFNPTNCNPMSVSGTLTGVQGASFPESSPFEAANCASLPFGPKLSSEAGGHGSKANGVGLNVKVESAGLGQANIAKVELQLPVQLPSRLTTIQKACTDAVFNVNPASCDEGSVIGKAIVHTPVFKNALMGPAYLVSHGNAAFPDVEFVLQGEGITLVLDGKTDIKKGITYSRFESTPDAPFTTFQTELPAGPHSVLGVNLPVSRNNNLCGTSLLMPTKITGQNGAVIKQTTHIRVTGCAKLTRAQLLAKALKACKKQRKRKRAACTRQAKKKYGAKAASKKKASSKKK
jgi:hypothetical protein